MVGYGFDGLPSQELPELPSTQICFWLNAAKQQPMKLRNTIVFFMLLKIKINILCHYFLIVNISVLSSVKLQLFFICMRYFSFSVPK